MCRLSYYAAALISLAVSACAPNDSTERDGSVSDRSSDSRFASSPAPARLIASSRSEIPGVTAGAANLTDEVLLNRPRVQYVEASALPFLTTSVEGAAFLSAPTPRALARGEPAANCPAAVSASGAASRAAAVNTALADCFSQLAARGAGAECGCRIVAIDDHLLDRRDAFGFAQTVSALVTGGGRRSAHLIAEALPPAGGTQQVVLRDVRGAVGVIELSPDEASAVLIDAPDRIYTGQRNRFGYRRGRMAERLELADASGGRLNILIGVERRDASNE